MPATTADRLETDPRRTALEDLAALLRGQGYDAAVDALHLTVQAGGRSVELWAPRRPSDSDRLWFAWAGEVWICPADQPQDAAVQVKKALRRIPGSSFRDRLGQ